jgi:hypothetical protein
LVGARSEDLQMDRRFFENRESSAHIVPVKKGAANSKHHFKKRDKLRRIGAHLDA